MATLRHAEDIIVSRSHGRRARRSIVASIALLSIGACTQAARAQTESEGTWRLLPRPPLNLSRAQTGVWTGREALFTVIAPRVRRAAAYDPARNRWRRLPNLALPESVVEGGDRSVWTGTDWLLLGQGFVAYRRSTNRWRKLAGPLVPANSTVVWTGTEMIGWGGGCCAEFNADGGAYAPTTNTWRRLPRSPLVGRQGAGGAWTGTRMIIVGGFRERVRGGVTSIVALADGAAYDPTGNRWRRLPRMPAARMDPAVVWTGRDLLVIGGFGQGGPLPGVFAYRPATNRWRVLRSLPEGRGGAAAVWTGSHAILWGGLTRGVNGAVTATGGLVYDPEQDRWSPTAAAPIRSANRPIALRTGRRVIVTGGGRDVAAFAP